jgi:hypothetical protein
MQKDIYKYINCSVRKIVGSCPGLAFAGGAGVSKVKIFRTWVLAFGESCNNVHMVFRNILCRFLGDLIGIVCESSRIYMQCKHHIQSVHIKLFYFMIKLQSNTHLTYYSHNNQKDQKLTWVELRWTTN